MRAACVLAAVAALWVQPASAADLGYLFELSGTVSGTTIFSAASPVASGPFTNTFDFLTPTNNAFGEFLQFSDFGSIRSFTFQRGGSIGQSFSGSFQLDLLTGAYSPVLLNYNYYAGTSTCNFSGGNGQVCLQTGSTSQFAIAQLDGPAPVPEPATWAMMLLGFGLVGSAMRTVNRRQKVGTAYL